VLVVLVAHCAGAGGGAGTSSRLQRAMAVPGGLKQAAKPFAIAVSVAPGGSANSTIRSRRRGFGTGGAGGYSWAFGACSRSPIAAQSSITAHYALH
jgi:hypothetical protein